MDKQIYKAVTERSKGFCENEKCSAWIEGVGHLHHSISGHGKRQEHEAVETCFYICSNCHERTHKDTYFSLIFKLKAQINLMRKRITEIGIEEVRKELGGRLYG